MTSKLARGSSCVVCQQRKLRCDLNKPCSNCAKAGVDCRVVPLQPPRRRKRKPDEKELLRRIERYQSLLSQHGINQESAGSDDDDGSTNDHANDHDASELSTMSGAAFISSTINTVINSSTSERWELSPKEYKHGLSLVSGNATESEHEQSLLYRSYNASSTLDASQHYPFVVVGESSVKPLSDQHPNAIQIFQLWQAYISNVDPLMKLTHTPTVQKQMIAASANLSAVTDALEALMFNIYLIAIISLSTEEVQEILGENKAQALSRHHRNAQQSLVNANFMSSSDLVVLQAHVLYLISIREFVDPRSHYCLIGLAVRVAQRLSLHRDGSHAGLPPFEIEQRRRLWWNLVALDKRMAELSGSPVSASSTVQNDCKRPLNVNDSDLHLNAKEAPAASKTPTEMVFVLARYELATAAAPHAIRPLPSKERSPVPKSTHIPKTLTHVQGYSDYVEDLFVKPCDPSVPLHLFTKMTVRQTLCKLNIISNIHRLATRPASIPREDRAWLLSEAVQMMESDNVIQASSDCRGFLWYAQVYSPFPAYMIFAQSLRDVSDTALCERAWKAIDENHKYRGLNRALQPPTHVGLATLFLHAWDAWDNAKRRAGQSVLPIKFIAELRQLLSSQANATHNQPPDVSASVDSNPMGKGSQTASWSEADQQVSMQDDDFGNLLVDWEALFPQQFTFDANVQY